MRSLMIVFFALKVDDSPGIGDVFEPVSAHGTWKNLFQHLDFSAQDAYNGIN